MKKLLTIRMSEEQKLEIQRQAEKEGRNFNNMLERMAQVYLDRVKEEENRETVHK